MPWIIGMILVSYYVGIVSNFSGLVRTILCSATSRKDVPGERLLFVNLWSYLHLCEGDSSFPAMNLDCFSFHDNMIMCFLVVSRNSKFLATPTELIFGI